MAKRKRKYMTALVISFFFTFNPFAFPDEGTALNGKIAMSNVSITKSKDLRESFKIDKTEIFNVKRNKIVHAAILIDECTANEKGLCNITFDAKIISPNGKAIGNFGRYHKLAVCKNQKPPEHGDSIVADDFIAIRIEDNEPSGKYEIVANIQDLNSSEELTVKKIFSVD